jgi:hypothetical protein
VCDDSLLADRNYVMPKPYPEDERKRQLECLRLASDHAQLAKDSPDPDARANFRRMADIWTDQAYEDPPSDDANG